MAWWSPALNVLAEKLSQGCLNEMKRRILKSNIQKQKLKLNEDTQRMRDFFEREIKRHNNRKQKLTERKEQNRLLQLKLQKAQQDIEELHTKLKNYEKEIKRLRKKNTKRNLELFFIVAKNHV